MVKRDCGTLAPMWFMSDIALQFYNAWVGINGGSPMRLLCTWHVDKAWREELRQKIGDVEVESQVYKMLRTVLEQPNEDAFEDHLSTMLGTLEEEETTKAFLDYFKRDWITRKPHWGYHYRAGLEINTNMFVEAFHRVFKYNYLKGKHNKRVDVCLLQLIKYNRDMTFKRAIKLVKGKDGFRIKEIKRRQGRSLEISTDNVDEVRKKTWTVKSTKSDVIYEVTAVPKSCQDERCELRCQPCNICIHQYVCNCPDNLIRHTMCKHIHLVKRYTSQKESKEGDEYPDTNEIPVTETTPLQDMTNTINNELKTIAQTVFTNQETSISSIKEKLQQKLFQLSNKVSQSTNFGALQQLEKILNAAENLFASMTKNQYLENLHVMTECPPNKKIAVQRKFFSTEKKRKHRSKVRYAKPTQQEKEDLFDRDSSLQLSKSQPNTLSNMKPKIGNGL